VPGAVLNFIAYSTIVQRTRISPKAWLAADAEALARAVQQGLIQEVPYEEEED
jgi:hypothetical protein